PALDALLRRAAGHYPPGAVDQLGAQDHPRRDVRRKRVADTRAGHAKGHEGDLAGTVARRARAGRDREPRTHHVGVVDATPAMAAIGHVAVLALHALPREPACLPLVVGGLEELAVEGEPVGRELVAIAAELGFEEGRRARDAVVRQALARSGGSQRAVATGRAEALRAPHMTASDRHAL